jgi:hypothetical protein
VLTVDVDPRLDDPGPFACPISGRPGRPQPHKERCGMCLGLGGLDIAGDRELPGPAPVQLECGAPFVRRLPSTMPETRGRMESAS